MFERFTESARRSIFFARYEAAQYGSHFIETEHLLLGILREDKRLAGGLFDQLGTCEAIRKQIEAQVTRGDRISSAVEMPLSQHSKLVLNLAVESAVKFDHPRVETVHMILGILRVEDCVAARILESHGLNTKKVHEKIDGSKPSSTLDLLGTDRVVAATHKRAELDAVADELVTVWAMRDTERLLSLFSSTGDFWDARGRRWTGTKVRDGVTAQFEADGTETERVSLEQILAVAGDVAVVTLGLMGTHNSARQLVVVLRGRLMPWRIASAHLSLIESS